MIRSVTHPQEKSDIALEILRDLPEWFGIESSLQNYVKQVQDMLFWVAMIDEKPAGFIALNPTSVDTVDIHVIGVKRDYHGMKIGTRLFETAEKASKEHYAFMQVKTVDEGHYDVYDATVQFYKHCGFKKLEVFPTLWDEHNPCLIMIKAL